MRPVAAITNYPVPALSDARLRVRGRGKSGFFSDPPRPASTEKKRLARAVEVLPPETRACRFETVSAIPFRRVISLSPAFVAQLLGQAMPGGGQDPSAQEAYAEVRPKAPSSLDCTL